MNSTFNKSRLAVLAAAALFALALPVSLSTAMAYDDDVEVICGDNDDGSSWCVSVEDLMTECPLSDPEYTTDECQGLLEDNRPTSRPGFFAQAEQSGGGNIMGTGKRPSHSSRN